MIKVEEKRRRIEASFLDDLFKDLSKSMFHGMVDRMEAGARDVVRWSLRRFAVNIIALGITIAAAILLLIAGIEGLKQLALPPFLAYLAVGLSGLAVGLLLLRQKREE